MVRVQVHHLVVRFLASALKSLALSACRVKKSRLVTAEVGIYGIPKEILQMVSCFNWPPSNLKLVYLGKEDAKAFHLSLCKEREWGREGSPTQVMELNVLFI